MIMDLRGGIVSKADDLVQQAVTGTSGLDRGRLANDLLREFQRGYPLGVLRGLLASHDVDVVKTAIWIASELGAMARPLLGNIVTLLKHEAKYVRSFAIDALLTGIREDNGDAVLQVASLLEDPERAVRLKVVDFMQRASITQLQAGASYKGVPITRYVELLRGILDSSLGTASKLQEDLGSSDAVVRMRGFIVALRTSKIHDQDVMAAALNSPDEQVREMATRSGARPLHSSTS